MQSEAVKEAVAWLKDFTAKKWNFMSPKDVECIKTLIKAAQSPASAVEVVTVEEFTDAFFDYMQPVSGVYNFECTKMIKLIRERYPNGLKIKPESE